MPITIDDITNDTNTGIFDELMASIEKKLDTQFNDGKITGGDYATVYLGAMQSVIQESIQFVQVKSDAAIKEQQSAADLALKEAQQDLTEQQAKTEEQNTLNAIAQGALLAEQKLKVIAETALITQKGISEWAQTQLLAKAGTPSGVIGNQAELYKQQSQGFRHKAASDVLKAYTDMFAVTASTDFHMPKAGDTGPNKFIYDLIVEIFKNIDEKTAYSVPAWVT